MKSSDPFRWLAAPAVLAAAAVPASAQVFLTEAQALAIVFGEGVAVRREMKTLGEAERRKLQEASSLRFPESHYTFFVGEQKGKVMGYAVVLDEVGKSEPITLMVGLSSEGKVTEAAVMVFRESRGWEVKDKRFLRQFRGKTLADPIRINQDILNYAGATLSSKALARGVKRALMLLDAFYPSATRRGPPHSGLLVMPEPPAAIAVASTAGGEVALYRQARGRMGTLCELRLWAHSSREAAQAFTAGFAELDRIEQVFSSYRNDSELARVNREAAGGPVEVSAEFWELARCAVRQWRQSQGCFDITVGPLAKVWGFWQGSPHVPSASELAGARAAVGSDKLQLDPHAGTVRFRRSGMEIDFGGLAKGYAAARVARLLARRSALAALVNLGGSSLCAARPEVSATHAAAASRAMRLREGSDLCINEWPVGVASPVVPQRPALFLILEPGWTLSTSGTYEQSFQVGGRTLSHLIDPRTGWPVEGLRSATVVSRSGLRSEVFTKQLLVLGDFERANFLRQLSRNDWALLESAEGQALCVRHHFRRATVLLPAPA